MTSEEHAIKFMEMFPNCPNPKHEPKKFEYFVKMYLFYMNK